MKKIALVICTLFMCSNIIMPSTISFANDNIEILENVDENVEVVLPEESDTNLENNETLGEVTEESEEIYDNNTSNDDAQKETYSPNWDYDSLFQLQAVKSSSP